MNKFKIEIQVRFADLDGYGHVNNAVYFTYLEFTRIAFLKTHFNTIFTDYMKKGIFLLIVNAECKYKRPISLDDKIFVTLWASKMGNFSFDLQYEIINDKDEIFALAKTVSVFYDDVNKKLFRIHDEFKKMVTDYFQIDKKK